MNKTLQWLLTIAITIVIARTSGLIASFSLFGTPEGTSLFSIYFLIAGLIFVIPLLVVVLLILAIIKENTRWIYRGYLLATLEMAVLAGFVYASFPFTVFVVVVLGVAIFSGYGVLQVVKGKITQ